ncbi:hypothetical protein V1289_008551 [Bradyrhizobium sp. AZCC 2289]
MMMYSSGGRTRKCSLRGAESVPKTSARQENTKVTIYHGTDCKLYDVVREGKLLGRRSRCFLGVLRSSRVSWRRGME